MHEEQDDGPRSITLPVIAAAALAIVLILLGLMTLGLTGGLLADLVAPVVEHLRGLPRGTLLAGDRAWPAALLLSFVAPLAIPFAIFAGLKLFSGNIWPSVVVTVLAVWAWSIAVLLVASLF